MSEADEYFTLVFRGDIRKFGGNPFKTDTSFGRPVAVSVGDCLAELDKALEALSTPPGEQDKEL